MGKFYKFILKIFGWKCLPAHITDKKAIFVAAPHTSNWDFIIGRMYYYTVWGGKVYFLIKKAAFWGPIGPLLKGAGGIPVDRSKRTNLTDKMVNEFNLRDKFHLAITPEGTRSARKNWKKGFIRIAQKANVPVYIVYLDYKKKEIGVKDRFFVTGNIDEDMNKIKSYYKNVTARYPENFDLGL